MPLRHARTQSRAAASEPVSITCVRSRIREIIASEHGARRSTDVVVLAIDGVAADVVRGLWARARTERMRSVFPTTSSSAWLSSLTGMGVDEHGVPGVAFRVHGSGSDPILVFEHKGELCKLRDGNIFSDAKELGYRPVAVAGDLDGLDCSWRDILLLHAERSSGFRFLTDGGIPELAPELVCGLIEGAIRGVLRRSASREPCLLWCYIDLDLHVHRFGYDQRTLAFLRLIAKLAESLAQEAVVVAYSDHGLTRTRHDPGIEETLRRTASRPGHALGGAGRTRWVYSPPGSAPDLIDSLARSLPASVCVTGADSVFSPGGRARDRVGDVVLLAEGDVFVTMPGYTFDHGSRTYVETFVPFSVWRA